MKHGYGDVVTGPHMKGGRILGNEADEARRAANVAANEALCLTCDGTGNELWSMYRKCPTCEGSGIAPRNSHFISAKNFSCVNEWEKDFDL